MKKIQEVVDKLSPEEKEQFKDLIAECLQREKDVQDSYHQSKESIKEFEKNLVNICNSFLKIQDNLKIIKTNLMIAQVTLYPHTDTRVN